MEKKHNHYDCPACSHLSSLFNQPLPHVPEPGSHLYLFQCSMLVPLYPVPLQHLLLLVLLHTKYPRLQQENKVKKY